MIRLIHTFCYSDTTLEIETLCLYAAAAAPSFTTPLSSVSARDGTEVTLSCVVVGQPAPSVTWYHNDRAVDRATAPDFAVSHDPATGRCRLTIADCMAADQGLFRCVARNAAGSTETRCQLTVLPAAAAAPSDSMTSSQVAPSTNRPSDLSVALASARRI